MCTQRFASDVNAIKPKIFGLAQNGKTLQRAVGSVPEDRVAGSDRDMTRRKCCAKQSPIARKRLSKLIITKFLLSSDIRFDHEFSFVGGLNVGRQ